jgi:hypothetical protein
MSVPECVKYTISLKNGETGTLNLHIKNNPYRERDNQDIESRVYQYCFFCGTKRFNQNQWSKLKPNWPVMQYFCEGCNSERRLDGFQSYLSTRQAIIKMLTEN